MRRAVRLAVLAISFLPTMALGADAVGIQPVRTKTAGDVAAKLVDTAGTNLLSITPSNTAGANAAQVLGVIFNSALPANATAGNVGMFSADLKGRVYVTTDAATFLSSNLAQIGGATLAFGSAVSASSIPVVIASDQLAIAENLTKVGGSAFALGQTTMSASMPVTLASNQSTITVAQGAPTGAATNLGTLVNIGAAGTSTVTCVGSLTVSVPVKLYRVSVTSQSPMACVIQYDSNAVITKWMEVMTAATSPMAQATCPAGFCGITAGPSGTQAIEASCTNLDSLANDVHCDVQFCNAASGC